MLVDILCGWNKGEHTIYHCWRERRYSGAHILVGWKGPNRVGVVLVAPEPEVLITVESKEEEIQEEILTAVGVFMEHRND